MTTLVRERGWLGRLRQEPILRRLTGYSMGSLVAAALSEAAFAATFGWGHAGTTVASAVGFVGGAVPNYILNRRWAWPQRRTEDRGRELRRYAMVSLASFVVSALVTGLAEGVVARFSDDHGWRVAFVATAFLAVSGLFFALKFLLYETLVFTGPEGDPEPQWAWRRWRATGRSDHQVLSTTRAKRRP
ncbi:MAG: GtrA family protein [Acidimicrobiales bacterium]